MTKKIFTLAAGLLLATTAVQAEQFDELPKNEVSVSYGYGPAYYVCDEMSSVFTAFPQIAAITGLKVVNKKCFGVVNFDYIHHFSPKFGLGLNVSYSESHGDVAYASSPLVDDEFTVTEWKQKDSYITIMPTIKLEWFRREYVSMYSRFSAGVMILSKKVEPKAGASQTKETDSETSVYPMGQVSPFGIEAGSQNIRGFAEIGFGQCGIAQIGIRARF